MECGIPQVQYPTLLYVAMELWSASVTENKENALRA